MNAHKMISKISIISISGLLLLVPGINFADDKPVIKILSNGNKATIVNDTTLTITDPSGNVVQEATFGDCNYFSDTVKQLQKFQADIKNPSKFMKDDINYPLRWNYGTTHHTTFKSAKNLAPKFNKVFDKNVQQAILKSSPYELIPDQNGGVGLGYGSVWFCSKGIFVVN